TTHSREGSLVFPPSCSPSTRRSTNSRAAWDGAVARSPTIAGRTRRRILRRVHLPKVRAPPSAAPLECPVHHSYPCPGAIYLGRDRSRRRTSGTLALLP